MTRPAEYRIVGRDVPRALFPTGRPALLAGRATGPCARCRSRTMIHAREWGRLDGADTPPETGEATLPHPPRSSRFFHLRQKDGPVNIPSASTNEEWRSVTLPGLEGWYDASAHGRIRRSRGGKGARAGAVLAQSPTVNGFYRAVNCTVRANGIRTTFYVHRLVASAFHGPCPAGMVVHHIDHDPTNNRPENLRYVTQRENVLASARAGRMRAKLTPAQAREVARLYAAGVPSKVVGKMFGITQQHVWSVGRRSWLHLTAADIAAGISRGPAYAN